MVTAHYASMAALLGRLVGDSWAARSMRRASLGVGLPVGQGGGDGGPLRQPDVGEVVEERRRDNATQRWRLPVVSSDRRRVLHLEEVERDESRSLVLRHGAWSDGSLEWGRWRWWRPQMLARESASTARDGQ
jgi:hypothetical protein